MASVAAKKQPIDVNAASIVELKAELFRKQEEFKREKLRTGGDKPAKAKKPSVFEKRNRGIEKRAAKDEPDKRTAEEVAAEEETLRRARAKLEEKAALYEQMSKGKRPSVSTDREDGYLVDFEQKQMNRAELQRGKSHVAGMFVDEDDYRNTDPIPEPETPDEEWVEYTDSLGRSRRCLRKDLPRMQEMDKSIGAEEFTLPPLAERTILSDDMRREILRQKWEKEEEEMAQRQGPTHYENVRFDEVRSHGVGYYQFSKDEAERQEQLKLLNQLRDQTVEQRGRRDKLKAKRKAAIEARLEKVRKRKMKKTADSTTEPTDEEKLGDIDKIATVEPLAHPVAEVANTTTEDGDREKQDRESAATKLEHDVFAMISSIRKEVDDAQAKAKKPVGRHWDVFRNQEDDRPSEFAPPSSYIKNTPRPAQCQSSWQSGPNPIGAQLFRRKDNTEESSADVETTTAARISPAISHEGHQVPSGIPAVPPFPFMPFPPPLPGFPLFPPPGLPFSSYPSSISGTDSVLATQQNGPATSK